MSSGDASGTTAPGGPIARCTVHVPNDHLDRRFDYLVPDELRDAIRAGQVAEVVFAGRRVRAVVDELVDDTDVPPSRLRPLRRLLGPHVWLDDTDRELVRWAADRFASSAGAVLSHALPRRTVAVERSGEERGWFPPGSAPRPADPPPPSTEGWDRYRPAAGALLDDLAAGTGAWFWRPAPDERVGERLAELTVATLAAGRDVLVIVPDPVSATADAIAAAAGDLAVDLRGGPSDRVTYRAWLRARCGQARVVIGERGTAFFPLERLGLAVAVDEANPSLKERRAPRHHAREVVLERARRAGAHGLLVGTVPSARAWGLLTDRRLVPITAGREDERRHAPAIELSDGTRGPRTRIHAAAFRALRSAVAEGSYGVVLATRRGEGRALACRGCGERLACPTCASTVDPADGGRVLCEGCGWRSTRRPTCAACGRDRFVPLAAGTERIAEELARGLPGTVVHVLEGYAAPAPPPPAVLVTTRGSVLDHPPGPVGAIVLPDLDALLRRPTLDAAEDALRLAVAIARWAVAGAASPDDPAVGAGARLGAVSVVVQTREPEHHALQALVRWDPGGFWRHERERRAELRWPPVADAIRIDAVDPGGDVAEDLTGALPPGDVVLGPVPRGDRATYLVKAADRRATVAALAPLRHAWSKAGRDVRVDVDPVDVT